MPIDLPPVALPSAPSRRSPTLRSFFIALGLAFVVVAIVGFGPLQLDHLNGKLAISVIGQLHGVLMVAWLLTFIAQAVLVANRRIDLHRRIGAFGIGLGAAVWLSVAGLTVRALTDAAVPLSKRIDSSLPQLYVVLVFLPLFAMAIRADAIRRGTSGFWQFRRSRSCRQPSIDSDGCRTWRPGTGRRRFASMHCSCR